MSARSPAPPTATLEAVWPDGRRAPVVLGPVLAEGGDARVRALEGRPGLVAKVYRDAGAEPRRRAKLRAMLARPPAGALGGGPEVQLAWPTASLASRDAGGGPPAGFVMPRVDLEAAASLELLLSRRARRSAGLPGGYRFRVSVAANLAALVAALHDQGHYVVDLKPVNVLVYRGSGRVALLDCDGFSIAALDGTRGSGGGRFPAHQYTDGYIAPEALRSRTRPEALGEAQDRFALAAVVFRLLNGGLHPFQGVPRPGTRVPTTNGERVAAGLYPYAPSRSSDLSPPPGSAHDLFGARTRVLFDAAFAAGPNDRPAAAAWARHLRGLLGAVLRPCPESEDHARFGRNPCPQCRREARRSRGPAADRVQRPPAPSVQTPPRPVGFTPGPPQPSFWVQAQQRVPLAFAVALFPIILIALVYKGFAGGIETRDRTGPPPGEVLRAALEDGDAERAARTIRAGVHVEGGLGTAPGGPRSVSRRAPYGPAYLATGYPHDFLPTSFWDERTLSRRLSPPFEDRPVPEARPSADSEGPPRTPPLTRAVYPPFLHYAAVYSAPHAAALLLERGAPADSWHDGRSALTLAAANRGLPFDIGETVGEVVFEGRTLAAFLEHTRTTSRKIEAWADGAGRRLGPSLARSGWTYADADSWERTARDLVRHAALVHLLTAQADLEGRDEWGRTPLFYAAASGNAVAVRQLLEAGADPNAADAAGVTPLMTAADQATTDETDWLSATIVAALLAAGADSDARDLAGRRAADYVGDRALTAATKRSRLSVPESGPFTTSETLGVVQLAQEGGSAAAFELDARRRWYADNARRLPTAAPDDRADIGDGPGQPPYPDDPAPDAVATLPTGDDPLVVRCNAVNETDLTVEVTLQRTAHAGYGRVLDVYSATWDLGTSQVANSVWSQCLEEVRGELRRQPVDGPHRDALYDLEGDPERWPRRTAHVRVDGRPRPGRPNG